MIKNLKNIKILRIILALLILFIPLYPKFPLFSVNHTYVAIRLDDIIISLVIFIWLIYQVINKFPVFKKDIFKIFLVYFLAIILSGLNAYLINQIDPPSILLLHLLRRLEYMSLFFVTLDSIYDKNDLKYPLIFLSIATFFVDLYGYGQKYISLPVISTMNEEFSKGQLLTMNTWTRISSTFAGHYDLAAYMSVVLVIIGSFAVLSKNIYAKLVLILLWLFSFPILTSTASRVSIFAFWGGIILSFILIKKIIWIFPVSLLIIFSIFNNGDLNQRLLATIPSLTNQFRPQTTSVPQPTSTPTPQLTPIPLPSQPIIAITTPVPTVFRHGPVDEYLPIDADAGVARSGEIRFNVEWPRAINAFKKNILLGTGLGSITLATDNDYLRSLGESGILGFFAFSAIIGYFVLKTAKIIFKKSNTSIDYIALILFAALTTHLANAIFIDVLEASKTAYLFWIMMAIYYLALNPKYVTKNKK